MTNSSAGPTDRRVAVYDTTLRDGTQGTGISFSVADKIRVAERLDAFGIDYVEGGFPGSNPKDAEFFKEAKKRNWRHTKIAAFGATRRGRTKVEDDPARPRHLQTVWGVGYRLTP